LKAKPTSSLLATTSLVSNGTLQKQAKPILQVCKNILGKLL